MAFSSQFSLSLELTRLLPLGPTVNLFGGAMRRLARDLTSYGSDIVVEEDLAAVFGRLRVCPHFERTFRMAMGETERTALSKVIDIALESGPGPTVRRALTAPSEDFRYLSTVIQFSLLSATHDAGALAEALSDILRKRLEGAPADHPPPPGYDALLGVTRACQEQTNRFQWHILLHRVYEDLGNTYSNSFKSISSDRHQHPLVLQGEAMAVSASVLQGLVDMFLAVQSLPVDRNIHIRTLKGVPTIVTWAHHVHGFTVHVNIFEGEEVVDSILFGKGQPQVVIDAQSTGESDGSSVCLLNPSDGDILFHLADEGGQLQRPLEASCRRPLGGIAKDIILSELRSQSIEMEDKKIEQLLRQVISDVLSFGISNFCTTRDPARTDAFFDIDSSLNKFHQFLWHSPYRDWSRVELAIQVLFGLEVENLDSDAFSRLKGPAWPKRQRGGRWRQSYAANGTKNFQTSLGPLVCLVRIFSCVDRLDQCVDLPVPVGVLLNMAYAEWHENRRPTPWGCAGSYSTSSTGFWCESSLMESFAPILIGPSFLQLEGNGTKAFKRTSLISELGWSVYLPTVELMDPYSVSHFNISLRRGVPIHGSDLRRRIEDSAITVVPPHGHCTAGSVSTTPQAEDEQPVEASTHDHEYNDPDSDLSDNSGATFGRARLGITSSAFVVSFVIESPSWGLAHIGIRTMHRIGGSVEIFKLEQCNHEEQNSHATPAMSPKTQQERIYILNNPAVLVRTPRVRPGVNSLPSKGYFLLPSMENIAARWLCLGFWQEKEFVVALRHPQTCLQCVGSLAGDSIIEKSGDRYRKWNRRIIIL